jgi:hypothetical protein
MEGLKVKSGAKTLFLTPSGNVAEEKGGAEKIVGKWRSESKSNEAKNQLRYNVAGVEQASVPVKYSFNDFNQLVAVVPGAGEGGADGDPYTFRGRILINDNHDVVYEVYEKDGTQTANRVTIYGDISFAEKTNDLVIALAGNGECIIKGTKGANGISLMKAEKNFVAEFKADDLLRFMAITSNDFSNSPVRVPKKAVIEFVGKWDMKESDGENQLVFVSKIISSGGDKSVALGFAGQVRAVSFGFAYYADKNGNNLAFNIKGEHKWKSTEAKWELSIGYSERKFSAEFSGGITSNGKFGQFVMKGAAKIEHESGKKTLLSLELEGVYTFQNNRIAFKIDLQTSQGKITYDLLFEGKFVFKGGVLTFQVKFSNKNPNSDFAIEVAWKSNSEQLKMALSVVLEKDKKDIKLTFEFELRMKWKDGVLVKDPAKALAA